DVAAVKVFDRPLDCGLVVHSPDLFAGDHILNFAAEDVGYRRRSIDELQRVIDRTLEIQQWFPHSDTPKVVVSLGGFTSEAPASPPTWPPPRRTPGSSPRSGKATSTTARASGSHWSAWNSGSNPRPAADVQNAAA